MGKISRISAILILLFATNVYALTVMVNSPYPDYYTHNNTGTYFITSNMTYGPTPINDTHVEDFDRIGIIPPCTDCNGIITSVTFFVNNDEMNTEFTYPYDLKYPLTATESEAIDEFENNYYIIKAVVTFPDNSTFELFAEFFVGHSQQFDDLTLYYFNSDKKLTAGWAEVSTATYYEIHLWNMEREEKYPLGTTTELEIEFQVPRTGHYTFNLRSVAEPLSTVAQGHIRDATNMNILKTYLRMNMVCDWEDWFDETATLEDMKAMALQVNSICSIWSVSTNKDNAKVTLRDGTEEDRGWWLYGHVAPPSGGGVTPE